MHTILNGLNADQRAAVLHNHETGNQLLILAGAGSGKTSVLTKRIQYRIGSGVNPTSILALTFTDLAAREMRERVEKLYPDSGVKLCTFHSLALSLLKEEYPSGKGFELLGFKKAPTPKELSGNDFLCDLAEAGVQAKDISRDELFSDSLSSSVFKKTEICRQKIKETGEVVFEDLIYLAITLIEKFQEARSVLQDKFQEILVDEYQDINPSQYRLVRALLGDRKSLFAVGDDDQAIYGFRGADIGNILRFRKDFQASTLIRLEWNYRSVPQVLYLANRIFVNKPPLLRKVLRAGNRRQDELFLENRIPEFWESDCAREEIRRLSVRIREMRLDYNLKYSDFAILVRYNRQREYYEMALQDAGFPIWTENSDGIQVMTVHASKGLQFPVVFYAGLAEGLTPGKCEGNRKKRKNQLAEERRLFYVGVTRAEAVLVLLYCKERFWKGKKVLFRPSQFLTCLEKPLKDSKMPLLLFKIFVVIKALAYMAYAIVQITFRRIFFREIPQWLERRVQEFSEFCMRILRINLHIENQSLLAKVDWSRPVVIIANHQSYSDIPVVFLTLGRSIGFLAKYELKRIPFLNFWMKQLGCVFIRRKTSGGGKEAQQELLDSQVPRIVVFPEGTRSKDSKLHPFKSGGFRLAADWQATIIPIVIRGTRSAWEARKDSKVTSVNVNVCEPLDLKEVFEKEGKLKIRDFVIPEVRASMEQAL